MSIAQNIRELRKRYNMSQEYIAEKLGYKSFTTIQKWESGVAEPPIRKAKILADLFNVDLDELYGSSTPAATPSLPPDQASILAKYGKLSSAGKDDLHKRADELIALGYTEEEEIKKKEGA
jgi:transcriptional regulator with XRE-family HTH domain